MQVPGLWLIFRAAFIDSMPVCAGYLAMGFAAGVLLAVHSGLSSPLANAVISSGLCVSGALQFMLVEWIRNGTALWQVAFLTICLNLRYAVFGLSLLEEFRATSGLKRCYLIWTLTDETWALEVSKLRALERKDAEQARRYAVSAGQVESGPGFACRERPDIQMDQTIQTNKTNQATHAGSGLSAQGHKEFITYCLSLASLDHAWWVIGVSAGAIAGSVELPFASTGIDFAMTALFIVILVDQWRIPEGRPPVVAGIVISSLCLLGFGPAQMLPPTIAVLLAVFVVWRQRFGWQDIVAGK